MAIFPWLPIQVDLREALAMNVAVAERYHKLQSQFIMSKTLALRVLGRKLDLETSLKDHKQVVLAIILRYLKS